MTRKTVLMMVALFSAVVLGVVLTVFQPQKLIIDETVNEAAPVESLDEPAVAPASAASSDALAAAAAEPAAVVSAPMSSAPSAIAKTAAPTATAPKAASAQAAPKAAVAAPAAVPAASRSGNFRSLNHKGSGRALLVKTATGHVVRFENLNVENGPDLYVYLSPADSTSQASAFGVKPLILGKLKANRGNQNYAVPAGTDLTKYKSVAVWCKRFSSGFAVAPLA